jgi:hypothetical protein
MCIESKQSCTCTCSRMQKPFRTSHTYGPGGAQSPLPNVLCHLVTVACVSTPFYARHRFHTTRVLQIHSGIRNFVRAPPQPRFLTHASQGQSYKEATHTRSREHGKAKDPSTSPCLCIQYLLPTIPMQALRFRVCPVNDGGA